MKNIIGLIALFLIICTACNSGDKFIGNWKEIGESGCRIHITKLGDSYQVTFDPGQTYTANYKDGNLQLIEAMVVIIYSNGKIINRGREYKKE